MRRGGAVLSYLAGGAVFFSIFFSNLTGEPALSSLTASHSWRRCRPSTHSLCASCLLTSCAFPRLGATLIVQPRLIQAASLIKCLGALCIIRIRFLNGGLPTATPSGSIVRPACLARCVMRTSHQAAARRQRRCHQDRNHGKREHKGAGPAKGRLPRGGRRRSAGEGGSKEDASRSRRAQSRHGETVKVDRQQVVEQGSGELGPEYLWGERGCGDGSKSHSDGCALCALASILSASPPQALQRAVRSRGRRVTFCVSLLLNARCYHQLTLLEGRLP